MGERIEVPCPKCGKPFLTQYRKGHWEDCPSCGHAFYVTHDQEVRRMIERERATKPRWVTSFYDKIPAPSPDDLGRDAVCQSCGNWDGACSRGHRIQRPTDESCDKFRKRETCRRFIDTRSATSSTGTRF